MERPMGVTEVREMGQSNCFEAEVSFGRGRAQGSHPGFCQFASEVAVGGFHWR